MSNEFQRMDKENKRLPHRLKNLIKNSKRLPEGIKQRMLEILKEYGVSDLERLGVDTKDAMSVAYEPQKEKKVEKTREKVLAQQRNMKELRLARQRQEAWLHQKALKDREREVQIEDTLEDELEDDFELVP